jgi:hypothetical protein
MKNNLKMYQVLLFHMHKASMMYRIFIKDIEINDLIINNILFFI